MTSVSKNLLKVASEKEWPIYGDAHKCVAMVAELGLEPEECTLDVLRAVWAVAENDAFCGTSIPRGHWTAQIPRTLTAVAKTGERRRGERNHDQARTGRRR